MITGLEYIACHLLLVLPPLSAPKNTRIFTLSHSSSSSSSSSSALMEEGKDIKDQSTATATAAAAAAISRVPLTKTPSKQYREDETEECRFHNSLLELKDLRSQLHHAADYCESAFSKAEQKKIVLDGTKRYICEAIVAVVDHLGNVSSKVEKSLLANTEIVQTEQKIDCLKQRLLACQQYAVSLGLSSLQLHIKIPQFHQHYVSEVSHQTKKANDDLSRMEGTNNRASETPIMKDHSPSVAHSFWNHLSNNLKPSKNLTISGAELAKAVPVLEGPSILSKPTKPSFTMKSEDLIMLGGVPQRKKHTQGKDFLSFLRVSRRKR